MDFHSLSRRDLQALCKSKGIRANMSNAAMADALLQCLPSVGRTDEIGSTAPPPPQPMPAVKEVPVIVEQTHGSLLPRGGRARAKTRTAAAGNTEEDVPVADQPPLQGCQRTAARKAAVPPEAEEAIGEQENRCTLPRGGRARGKTRKAGARKTEEEVAPASHTSPGNKTTVAEEAAAAPVAAEEVAVGMRTRKSARSKVKVALDQKEEDIQAAARKEQKADTSDAAIASEVVADKSCGDSEEHVVVVAVEEETIKPQEGQDVMRRAAPYKSHEDEGLQQDQRTVEEVATAKKRPRRCTRSKVAAAARKGQKADSSHTTIGPEVDPKEDEVVPKVDEATKPQEGKNVTRRATLYNEQEVQTGLVTAAPEALAAVEAEEVAMAKKRTRRCTRSKVATAAQKGQKADSSDTTIGPEVDPKEDEVVPKVDEATKPQEGKNVTRRATLYKEQEEVQTGQVTAAPEAMAAVEAEEVAMAKKRTRRCTRSKVAMAAQKGQKADSSDTTIGPEVDPKEDEVVPKVEEAAKPQEGKNGTRRAALCKAQEEVQPGQVTVTPEAMAAVKAEEVATAKRRRRSARSKVRVAAPKGQKADSSDAVNGPTASDDPKEQEPVAEVMEEGPTKPNEEREQINNASQFASLPKLEDSPILGVVSKPNAADASEKAAVAVEEAVKEDDFTFTGEADLSNILVNTLDRFAKPMYVSTDKEEKKGTECWWMLL